MTWLLQPGPATVRHTSNGGQTRAGAQHGHRAVGGDRLLKQKGAAAGQLRRNAKGLEEAGCGRVGGAVAEGCGRREAAWRSASFHSNCWAAAAVAAAPRRQQQGRRGSQWQSGKLMQRRAHASKLSSAALLMLMPGK